MMIFSVLMILVMISLPRHSTCIAISKSDFQCAIRTLITGGAIPSAPTTTESEIASIRDAQLVDLTECPASFPFFQCDDAGRIVNLTLVPRRTGLLSETHFLSFSEKMAFNVFDYTGTIAWPLTTDLSRSLCGDLCCTTRCCRLSPVDSWWRMSFSRDSIGLRLSHWSGMASRVSQCSFVNVSVPCGVPLSVVQKCFGGIAPPCWTTPPAIVPPLTAYDEPCVTTAPCSIECSPTNGSRCDQFFPQTVGANNYVLLTYMFPSDVSAAGRR
jgi:hypothetical protein